MAARFVCSFRGLGFDAEARGPAASQPIVPICALPQAKRFTVASGNTIHQVGTHTIHQPVRVENQRQPFVSALGG